MLDQFIYENHLGQRFDGLANGVYLNTSELRNYTWSYQTINSRISRFYRKTTNRKIPLFVVGQTDAQAIEAMNRLLDITEADVALHVPGKIFVGEYYTTGFVTVSKKTEYLQSKQLCKMEMTLTSDDPAWYRDEVHSFYTDASTPKAAKSGDVITVSNVPASPVRGFTLYGRTTQDGTPTPDAPVALQSVGDDGDVHVLATAKNMLFSTGETGYLSNIDGAVTKGGGGAFVVTYYIPYQGGYLYVVTPEYDNQNADAYGCRVGFYDVNKNWISNITVTNKYQMVNPPLGTAFVRMSILKAWNTALYREDTDEYEASRASVVVINTPNGLVGIPVTSGGNYTDANGQQWIADTIEYNADAGTAKYVKRVHVVRLTSTSHAWTASGTTVGRYLIADPTPAMTPANVAALCTAFPGVTGSTSEPNVVYTAYGTRIGFNSPYATLNEWKAYLDANEIYLAYAIKTPVETDLTTSEFYALRMQSPNTTLYNEDGAFMDVVYSTVENTSGSAVGGFDYPYEYNLEYGVQIGGRSIANSSYTGNAFRIMIYGAVINPTIIIGGHPYTVNGAVGEGETLTIDSMTKTITLTTASGAKINYFDKRDRQNYIFQPIRPGQNAVAWSGDFGFELTVIEERSEPKWT